MKGRGRLEEGIFRSIKAIRRKRSVFNTGDLMWREVSKEVPIDTHIKQWGGS